MPHPRLRGELNELGLRCTGNHQALFFLQLCYYLADESGEESPLALKQAGEEEVAWDLLRRQEVLKSFGSSSSFEFLRRNNDGRSECLKVRGKECVYTHIQNWIKINQHHHNRR